LLLAGVGVDPSDCPKPVNALADSVAFDDDSSGSLEVPAVVSVLVGMARLSATSVPIGSPGEPCYFRDLADAARRHGA